MVFIVLHGCTIVLFIISLNENVFANSCENDNCKAAIDVPLISKLNAPLKAELDISGLTTQLKELIGYEVKKAVSVAMNDIAENIADKRAQSALEKLQTNNNRTISSFLQELEDESTKKDKQLTELELKVDRNNDFHNKKHNTSANEIHSLSNTLDSKVAEMNENQIKTDVKLSSIESEVTKNSEKVALLALKQPSASVNGIIKFHQVKFSIGFNNMATFTNTGKIVCEKSGLYMITVSIISLTPYTEIKIMLNGNMITKNRFADGGQWHTGTNTMVLQLHVGDNIWVETDKALSSSGGSYNSFSIIKVK